MADVGERQRTVLRAPRVEFDLSALSLGAVGYLAYQWIWPALASLLAVPTVGGVAPWRGLQTEFFLRVLGFLRLPYGERIAELVGVHPITYKEGDKVVVHALNLPWWKLGVVAAALLVLWSVVAGALSRVYAVRIARDESIGAGDGLAFAFSNLRAFVQAPLFVAAAAVFFAGLAALAGAASPIPVAGPFVELVAYPLALVASLVVTVFLVGLVFGLPVMQAALATEKNGTLDAISRTFSYVFTRPVTYLVAVVMVTVVAMVILRFGVAFLEVAARALTWGASWNAEASNLSARSADQLGAMQYGIAAAASPGGLLGWPAPGKFAGLALAWVYASWAITCLAVIAVHGFVLSYFVGGLTDTYFLLRREVDGIDDSEVWVEGAEASLGEPLPGEPVSSQSK